MSVKSAQLSTPRGDLLTIHVNVCDYCGQMEMFPNSVSWITVSDRHFCSPEHEQAFLDGNASSMER